MQHQVEFQVIATLDGMRGMPMTVMVPVPHWFDSWMMLQQQEHQIMVNRLTNELEETRHALKMATTPKRPWWKRVKG